MTIQTKIKFKAAALAVCICFSLWIPNPVMAIDAQFTWEASPEPVTGYKLYYKIGGDDSFPYEGTGLSGGNSPIFIDNRTSYTLSGLSVNETYHFALKAYNGNEESDYSTTVSFYPTPTPIILNISIQ